MLKQTFPITTSLPIAVSKDGVLWMYYLNVGMYNGLSATTLDDEYYDLPEPVDEMVTITFITPSTF